MATRQIDLEIDFQGNAIEAVNDLNSALAKLAENSDDAGEVIDRTTSFTRRFEANVDTATTSVQAANKAIDSLTREISETGLAYQESAQKILDAQRKLSEFGASAETQQIALGKISAAINDLGVDATKAAIVMEELAIEFGDGAQAVQLYDRAVRFAEGSIKRTEDAIADFADAAKGGTSGLAQYGRATRGVADAIDNISDPALRARKSIEALERAQRKAAKGAGIQTKAMDQVALAQLKIAESGPIVAGALSGVGIAAAAAGAAMAAFAVDSIGKYIAATPQVKDATDDIATSFGELQVAVGGALLGDIDESTSRFQVFEDTIDAATETVKNFTPEIRAVVEGGLWILNKALQGLTFTGAAALSITTGLIDLFKKYAEIAIENRIVRPLQLLAEALELIGVETDSIREAQEAVQGFADALGNTFLTEQVWDMRDSFLGFTEAVVASDDAVVKYDDSVKDLSTSLRALSEIDLETALDPLETLNAFIGQTGGQPRATGSTGIKPKAKRRAGKSAAQRQAEKDAKEIQDRVDRLDNAIEQTLIDREIEIEIAVDEMKVRAEIRRLEQAMASALAARSDRLRSQGLSSQVEVEPEAVGLGGDLFGAGQGGEADRGEGAAGALFGDDPAKLFEDLNEQADIFAQIMEEAGLTAAEVGKQIGAAMNDIAVGFGAAIVSGENLATTIGKTLASTIGNLLITLGSGMVAAGLGFAKAPGLQGVSAGWVAGGLAVSAAGGVLTAFAGAMGGGAGGSSSRGTASTSTSSSRASAANGGGILGDVGGLRRGTDGPGELTIVAQFGDDATGRVVGQAQRRNRRQRATR